MLTLSILLPVRNGQKQKLRNSLSEGRLFSSHGFNYNIPPLSPTDGEEIPNRGRRMKRGFGFQCSLC